MPRKSRKKPDDAPVAFQNEATIQTFLRLPLAEAQLVYEHIGAILRYRRAREQAAGGAQTLSEEAAAAWEPVEPDAPKTPRRRRSSRQSAPPADPPAAPPNPADPPAPPETVG